MEEYYLNMFVPVVQDKKNIILGLNGTFTGNEELKLEYSKEKLTVLEKMAVGKPYQSSDLIEIFGSKDFEGFIENSIFIPYKQNTDDLFSRTDEFYKINKFGNIRNVLSKKRILILGCGGIGTHVAWNLVTAGIGEIVLLDFDVVEKSNLNRQLLYDIDDIGLYKIDVLKKKLNKINPELKVITMNKKILCQLDLEEVCLENEPDLIIKSLDSPEEFPVFLDHVCSKLNIPYISGTSASTHAVIGPTYIPEQNSEYTKFFMDTNNIARHVSGLSPSLSLVMYDMSNEISIEAFKLLTKTGKLKYDNLIIFKNKVSGNCMEIVPKNIPFEVELDIKYQKNKNCLIIAFVIFVFALAIRYNYVVWLGALLLSIYPVIIFSTYKYAIWAVFQNISWYMLVNYSVSVINNKLFTDQSILQILSMVFTLLLMYSLTILLFCGMSNLLFYLKKICFGRFVNGR